MQQDNKAQITGTDSCPLYLNALSAKAAAVSTPGEW